jgi:hypothetical protein
MKASIIESLQLMMNGRLKNEKINIYRVSALKGAPQNVPFTNYKSVIYKKT